jgi:putative nucleotidyltransferase with HDIG domain
MTDSHIESPHARVLVVDDEETIRDILADFLEIEGFSVTKAMDGKSALAELTRGEYDMVISDLKMPNMGGIDLLDAISKQSPSTVTVIMTGFGTVETAIDAMKRGAYDYITKPFKMEQVVHVVRRGLEKKTLEAENLRLKEAVSLYRVSEAIADSLSLEEVLETVVHNAVTEVNADVALIFLDEGENGYQERSRKVHPKFTGAMACGELDPRLFTRFFQQEEFLLVQGRKGLQFFQIPPRGIEPRSLVVTQLKTSGRTMGYVVAISFSTGKIFDEGQRKLLSIISNRAAATIENARLYEDLKLTFEQTLLGFVSAIDKMDQYTAGHSEGVARYAKMLAVRLGLSADQVQIVRQAALMHDVGKIGCVASLNKPDKLTAVEYESFKKHPEYGKEILEPIKFMATIIPGVRYHHERWDGLGYPRGLKGEETPLVARIIALADAYDAMTSDRAYRRALTHEATMQEITSNAGTQFDPHLVQIFSDVIEEYRLQTNQVLKN